jgi:hypothetical protein
MNDGSPFDGDSDPISGINIWFLLKSGTPEMR